ncbi:hypothetical protein [Streptomyces sp. NPDC006368]|uniref:hypothetical protein n=1 Tax=Streptomyces sp. NPDC006368 TaxID=3156760 RepID=UPI0033A332DD
MNATSTGALLLCRSEPSGVRPAAGLLRERLLLTPAGRDWSVLVPEGRPWREGAEPVDRVVASWATALAVAAPCPVLALWWDADRAGYTLASGFRRPVGYTWLADGTPAGEDEAMHTFAARLRLDPVLDVQALGPLTRPDKAADARARLLGLTAVLARTGLALPPGLTPGDPAARLRTSAEAHGAEPVEWSGRRDAVRHGTRRVEGAAPVSEAEARMARDTVRAVEDAVGDVVGSALHETRLAPWLLRPRIRLLATVQLVAGLPVLAWAVARRSAGWATAGAVLVANGAIGLALGAPTPRPRRPAAPATWPAAPREPRSRG